MTSRPLVIVFDVIETLFGLEPLRPHFSDAGMTEGALETWFATALRDMFALSVSGSYAPMQRLLEASLDEVEATQGGSVDRKSLIEGMGKLPPHPDVPPGIKSLRDSGFRIIALTNGSRSTTQKLLDEAGISSSFEKLVSTDEIERAKPHPDVYVHAAREMDVDASDLMLVASHPWDIQGARSAGLKAAYLDRGKPFPDFMKSPDLTGKSLTSLAEQLDDLGSGSLIDKAVDELTG